jgi:hypothetical protein
LVEAVGVVEDRGGAVVDFGAVAQRVVIIVGAVAVVVIDEDKLVEIVILIDVGVGSFGFAAFASVPV